MLKYSINNGLSYQNNNTFNNIAAGEYKVTVKDANGCIQHSNLTIQQPEPLTVTTNFTPISCYGGKTTITVSAAGGNGSYQYALGGNNYQTNHTFENIGPGEYSIYVKDANECIQSKMVTITAPELIKISTSFTSIQCNGDRTTLLVTASGGTGNFTYSINGGNSYQNSNEFGNLLAGTYQVYVKDQNNCTQQKQVVIEQPTKLEFTATSTPITCFGDKSVLTVITSGGTAPFSYSINSGSSYQNSNEFTNLSAGEYTVLSLIHI